jgi:hypothetical protein
MKSILAMLTVFGVAAVLASNSKFEHATLDHRLTVAGIVYAGIFVVAIVLYVATRPKKDTKAGRSYPARVRSGRR